MSHHCLCSMDKRGGGEIQNWSNEDESSGARFRWKTMTSFPVKEFRTRIFLRDGHHSFVFSLSQVLPKTCRKSAEKSKNRNSDIRVANALRMYVVVFWLLINFSSRKVTRISIPMVIGTLKLVLYPQTKGVKILAQLSGVRVSWRYAKNLQSLKRVLF